MWIFGYGSLIWKPGFDYLQKTPGYIRGWKRRFYQGSPDHRGVPERPGRVVTLLRDETCWTWGMAYRVSQEVREEILQNLDHREQGGYERHFLEVFAGPEEAVGPLVESALVYLASPHNPHYLGPATEEEIARHVARSQGPSGPNEEYVLALAKSLVAHQIDDPHVASIAGHLEVIKRGES